VPPEPDTPSAPPALLAILALGLLVSVAIALWPSGPALLPALATLARDVATHDSETLRREHDGWYARLLPAYAAVEALPAGEPLLLTTQGVPPFFVAARFPERRVFADSDALRAELAAQGRRYHVLRLQNADPLRWTLETSGEAPR
jgi:hypothetical protein